MMNTNEAIEMLEILIQSACNVSDTLGRSATVLDNVKLNSFTWVIEEAIKLLKKSSNILPQLTEAQQKVMKIMKEEEESNQTNLYYQGGFVEGLDLAINLVKKANEND